MKIAKLHIKSFRGIPNECQLNFTDKQNKPISCIIYGGNGSGKSSIVDAIEYCLQGRIERSPELRNAVRPSTINLASEQIQNPSIDIIFDDGTCQERSILVSKDENNIIQIERSDSNLNPSFSKAPIVLRRNDIISYNMTEEAQRQVLLLQFMYDSNIHQKLAKDPEIMALDKKLVNLRRKRKSALEAIPKIIDISLDELKQNANNVEQRIREIYSPIGQKMAFNSSLQPKKQVRNDVFEKAISKAQDYDAINRKYKKLNKNKRDAEKVKSPEKFQELQGTFAEASKYLTSAFKNISNVNYVDDIQLAVGDLSMTSLNINVKLVNGKIVSPNQIFSEANYDLMILLLYISLIRVGISKGQEKILILDDVLQSVDANIRANFIVYILNELKDWQLFITCHDRLWLNQLKIMFHNASHSFKEYHISNWSFSSGPMIAEANYSSVDDTLKQAIETKNIRIMASMSGLFLEKICQNLSISLHCRIERKVGDRYTLGDLWPSVKKSLKKTSLNSTIEKIDKLLCIRNLLGAHYNQWAEAFDDSEVLGFAEAVQQLYEGTYCNRCNNWIEKPRSKEVKNVQYECPCRNIQY